MKRLQWPAALCLFCCALSFETIQAQISTSVTPFQPSIGNVDSDGDGVYDTADLDADNDGLANSIERDCENFPESSAHSVVASTSVGNPHHAIGSNNRRAVINRVTDELILDLEHEVPSGTGIWIEARTVRSYHVLQVEESLDGEVFSNGRLLSFHSRYRDLDFFIQTASATKYLRFTMFQDMGRGSIKIDHVRSAGFEHCLFVDSDGDGLENYLDRDSDNDGCYDVVEAGFTDNDADGYLDGTAVDSYGLIIGNTDGYTGTSPEVRIGLEGNCLSSDDVVYHDVNISSDLGDVTIGDGVCADVNGDCSLRAAIEEANSGSGYDVITFSMSGDIILDSELPTIHTSVVIEGASAPGYVPGTPAVRLVSNGTNLLSLAESHDSFIRGLDLSGPSSSGMESYGIVLSHCTGTEIADNVIRNRERAIYTNNSCGMHIHGNDLRDSGAESWDAAAFILNLCPGSTGTDLLIEDNQYGALNTNPRSGIQVLNASGVISSDESMPEAHIQVAQKMEMEYPIRYVNVHSGEISNMDLSSSENKEGFGIRLLDCENIKIKDTAVRNRETAVEINGGTGYVVNGSDFTGSGLNDDYSLLKLEDLHIEFPSDLEITENIMDYEAHTVLNMLNCSGIQISSEASSSPNVLLNRPLTGHTPLRFGACSNMSVSGIDFTRDDQMTGTEGMILEGNSSGIIIEDCSFQGFASGINLASVQDAQIRCNTMSVNANGVWVFGNSTVEAMSENSFYCNEVGIHNHTGNVVTSSSDFWGHSTGSSSYSGLGDYYIGSVDARTYLEERPPCASRAPEGNCSFEICDNGIDDDGDGLIDCDDGSCVYSAECGGVVDNSLNKSLSTDLDFDQAISLVFPNPSSGPLSLILERACDEILLRDLSGRVLLHEFDFEKGPHSIDLSGMSNGMYLIEAIYDGQRQSIPVVRK